jgi:hypothetical protein
MFVSIAIFSEASFSGAIFSDSPTCDLDWLDDSWTGWCTWWPTRARETETVGTRLSQSKMADISLLQIQTEAAIDQEMLETTKWPGRSCHKLSWGKTMKWPSREAEVNQSGDAAPVVQRGEKYLLLYTYTKQGGRPAPGLVGLRPGA